MSKGSSSNIGDTGISTKYIDYLVSAVADVQATLKAISETHKNDISERKKEIEDLTKAFNKGDISSKQYVKSLADIAKGIMVIDYDVKSSAKFNKAESNFITKLSKSLEGQKIDSNKLDKVLTAISNLNATGLSQGEKEASMGVKSPIMKGSSTNKRLEEILKEIKKNTASKDDSSSKLQAFFGDLDKKKEKRERGFVKDIIEGIASSKFIGGALGDLIKLGGLRANQFLSQYGKVGQFLGKVVLVLSQILATLLSGSIISNILGLAFGRKMFGWIGNAFKGGANLLKGVFKGGGFAKGVSAVASFFSHGPRTMTTQMAKSTLKAGTVFRDSATGKLRKVVEGAVKKDGTKSLRTVAVKSAKEGIGKAASKSLLKKIPGVGLVVGGGLAAGRAVAGDWGGAGLELLSGIASTIPGWGTAASVAIDAGLMAKDAGLLKGIGKSAGFLKGVPKVATMGAGFGVAGLAGAGLYTLLKNHFAKQEKSQEEGKNNWQLLLDMLKDSWIGKMLGLGGNEGSGGSSGGSFVNNIVEGVKSKFLGAIGKDQDTKKVSSVGALELNKAGGMINIGSMNKMQASNAVLEYMNKRPDQFKSAYELVGSKYASLGSFQNDLAIRNKQGSATQAVLYAGATKNLENAWDALEKAGFSRNRAELMKYTSGRSTATSVHKKYGARSHSNIMNMTTDLAVGNQWTDAEWKKAIEVLRPIYAQQGFDLQFEGTNKKGKTVIGSDYVPGLSNKHFHVGLLKGKEGLMPQSALKYQEQQKAVAQQHSIDTIGLVTKLEGKEKAEKIGKDHLGDDKAFKEAYEKVLKDYGITHKTDSKGKERWYYHDNEQNVTKEFDPTGNLDALKKQMTYMTNNAQ